MFKSLFFVILKLKSVESSNSDLHVGYVGGKALTNILPILLWALAVMGEQHCLVIPDRLVDFHISTGNSMVLNGKACTPGCIKKVIKLWSALNRSFTVLRSRRLAFDCHHFSEV